MKLTPIDIEQQKFRGRLRGYDTREVHHFLEMVASQIAELNRDVSELRGVVKTHERLIEVHDEELREPAEAGLTLLDRLRAPEPPDLAGGMGDDVVSEISQ